MAVRRARLVNVTNPIDIMRRNREWAAQMQAADPNYFRRLVGQQAPRILWIGCSDSRVPANVIAGLDPGEVFVHRNIANVVPHTDLNVLSVLEFAVNVLKVEHIIVCGHYRCGGVLAALDGQRHGLIDNWLRHIKDVAAKHSEALELVPADKRAPKLAELNAIEQARNVCYTNVVQEAWAAGRSLTVRAWIYDVEDGLLRDLRFAVSGPEELSPEYRIALEPEA